MPFSVLTLSSLLVIIFGDVSSQVIIPDSVQEFHACVRTTAYIPWPTDVAAKSDSAMLYLSFQHRRSERKSLIATFNRRRKLLIEAKRFSSRLVVSSENNGIFLKQVSLDDAGTFIAQARMSQGDVWTRTTNLIVHLRPIIVKEKLNLSIAQTYKREDGLGDCLTLSCGKLEYVGYPAAKFVWMAGSQVVSSQTATDDSYTVYEVCSPFHGEISCGIAGHSSVCTYDRFVSMAIDLPAPSTNTSAVRTGTTTSEYILMIGMPALAIGVPLLVLGIWLLAHLLKSRRENRGRDADKDHNCEGNHIPPPPPPPYGTVLDVNSVPSTSNNNQSLPSPPPIEDLSMSQSITFDKDDGTLRILTRSPTRRKEPDPIPRPNTPHRPAHDSDDEEEEEEDDEDDDEEDDSDEEPEEDRKESQPLMEDSITSVTL